MFANRPDTPWQQLLNSWSQKSWGERLPGSGNTLSLLLALAIGGFTGATVVVFRLLIERIHDLAFEGLDNWLGGSRELWILTIPIVGGIAVGLLRWYWKDFGKNLAGMLNATQTGEQMQPGRGIVKMLAAAISLGTGASLGPEGPSVEIGANFGVWLGQLMRVSQERRRLLLAAGAAAGVAAGFNSPIAGVFFALEVVLVNTLETSAVSVVVLAAVSSSLIEQIGVGAQPAFKLPVYEVRSAWELPLYLGLGIGISLLSYSLRIVIQWSRDFFQGEYWSPMASLPIGVTPAIGGLFVGLVALKFPQILGIGYETVEAMLQDVGFSLVLLGSLVLAKLVMTAVSLGSGLVGGLFAPSMFLGASMGTFYAKSLVLIFPLLDDAIAAPPAYAMVGMAAMLATTARAPLTAILLMFELTRDYRIVLPLMACVSLSMWLVDRFPMPVKSQSSSTGSSQADSKLNPEQMDLGVQPQNLLIDRLQVSEVMTQNWFSLPAKTNLLAAAQIFLAKNVRSAIVMNDGVMNDGVMNDGVMNDGVMNEEQLAIAPLAPKVIGIVTIEDINRALSNSPESAPELLPQNRLLSDICSQPIIYAHPEEVVATALAKMAGRGLHQLPVVAKETPTEIVGVLDRENISMAYSLAITRMHLDKHQIGQKAD
jgi:H+/Cl- antiporter ClcA/CBS domain-containing protein